MIVSRQNNISCLRIFVHSIFFGCLWLLSTVLPSLATEQFDDIRPFQAALNDQFPEDQWNSPNYITVLDRVVATGQLASAQIMLLDEIIQAAEDDQVCVRMAARGSVEHEECTKQFYSLPPMLERLHVADTCKPSLALVSRIACFFAVEAIVMGRRGSISKAHQGISELQRLDDELAAKWYNGGQPSPSEWNQYPEAETILKLDSLMVHASLFEIATRIQAAEMYDYILAFAHPSILGPRSEEWAIQHFRQDRRTRVQDARNRSVAPWISRPAVSLSGATGKRYEEAYRSWILAARTGENIEVLSYVGPQDFDLQPVVSTSSVEQESQTAAKTEPEPKEINSDMRKRPALYVEGGVPIRIPPSYIPAAEERTVGPLPKLSNTVSPIVTASEDAPEILIPSTLVPCEIRSNGVPCGEQLEKTVVYSADTAEEVMGAPAGIAVNAAASSADAAEDVLDDLAGSAVDALAGEVFDVVKRLKIVGSLYDCFAEYATGNTTGTVYSCVQFSGLGSLASLNPNFGKDREAYLERLPLLKIEAERKTQQLMAKYAAQREFERHILSTRERRALAKKLGDDIE